VVPRGGGVSAPDPGLESCLGGNRGGRPGFGFGVGAGLLPFTPSFLKGGGGRCDVERPVVSTRKGKGGAGFGSSSFAVAASSLFFACISSCVRGAPSPLLSGVIWFGNAVPPWKLTFLGGGPNDAGSFRLDNGRETWSFAASCGSLPFPIHPACRSQRDYSPNTANSGNERLD
jgi:hypothetical protein